MKKNIMVLLVFAISTIFSGCFQQQGSNVLRWSFWGSEARIRNYQLSNDIFAERTGIIIAGEPAPGTGQHFDKFRTQFAGGFAADIVQLGGYFSNLGFSDDGRNVVGTMGYGGLEDLLLPLDSYVRSGHLDISNVDKAAIDAGTRNGILYAIPVATNMPALVYNKSLLERVGAPLPEVGMTWNEFDTWLRQVQEKLPRGIFAMTDNGATVTGSVFFSFWCADNGTPVWDGSKTNLTASIVRDYFDLWAGWRASGLIPPAAIGADFAETNEATSSLIAGRTAVTYIWSNQLSGYQNATTDTLDLIMLPNAVVSNCLWGQMSQMMAVNKNTRNPQAAAQFISYRINDPGVWEIMGADPGVPVTPAARNAILADATPVTEKVVAYLNVAGSHSSPANPNMPNDTEWNAGLHLIYQNAAYGRINSGQAGQQVMDLIARLTR